MLDLIFRNVSKAQARTYALVSVFVGLLIFWIGAGSGDAGGGFYIASIAWGVAAIYGFVWRHKAARDRTLAAAPHPVDTPTDEAPPTASPESSSFELPDLD